MEEEKKKNRWKRKVGLKSYLWHLQSWWPICAEERFHFISFTGTKTTKLKWSYSVWRLLNWPLTESKVSNCPFIEFCAAAKARAVRKVSHFSLFFFLLFFLNIFTGVSPEVLTQAWSMEQQQICVHEKKIKHSRLETHIRKCSQAASLCLFYSSYSFVVVVCFIEGS